MRRTSILFLVAFFIILNGIPASSASRLSQSTWMGKVAPDVLKTAESGEVEYLVILRDQADLNPARPLKSKEEKGTFVFKTLTSFANTNQKPLRRALEALRADYQTFWVTNMIWVQSNLETLQELAQRKDVAKIASNPSIPLTLPPVDFLPRSPQVAEGIEWNIDKIHAPMVWDLGYTGQGVIIGGQDTGYTWDHPALINSYRGWNGSTVDHNYSWFDATEPSNTTAVDPHGHGTHTMGIMVGDDGGFNQIGVAPGAKWIGCRNMDEYGNGTPATYTACYQWFIAPTDLNGENPDPTKAPDVINNSWSCPEWEGCTDTEILLPVVQAVRAAGIVTVHSAGNKGDACASVAEPAAIYGESFSVGATDSSDTITYFSSRGPVTVDESDRLKPNITAPGSGIRSSYPEDRYVYLSGTSMAAPHVAGLVALLLSTNPKMRGDVDQIETLIENYAIPRITDQECGGIPGTNIPNNTYGYGRVDAISTILASLNIFYFPLVVR